MARRIAELKPGAGVLAESGRALLQGKLYAPAKEMLAAAAAATPPADVAVDLAIANAQVLDASGRHEEAIAAIQRALAGAPSRIDVYWQAAGLLLRNRRIPEALRLFDGAADPEMLLMKAVLLELAGQSAEAGNLLNEVQERRPEWFAVWVARGMMQASHNQAGEKRASRWKRQWRWARGVLKCAMCWRGRRPRTSARFSWRSPRTSGRGFSGARRDRIVA